VDRGEGSSAWTGRGIAAAAGGTDGSARVSPAPTGGRDRRRRRERKNCADPIARQEARRAHLKWDQVEDVAQEAERRRLEKRIPTSGGARRLTARQIAREFQRKEWREHGSGRRRRRPEALGSGIKSILDVLAEALEPQDPEQRAPVDCLEDLAELATRHADVLTPRQRAAVVAWVQDGTLRGAARRDGTSVAAFSRLVARACVQLQAAFGRPRRRDSGENR
jgi:hypothetical protein